MKEIAASLFIAVKPDRVWRELAAFRHYRKWNPFVTAFTPDEDAGLAVGAKVELVMHLAAADGQRQVDQAITARLTKVEPEHELRWEHGSWLPGLLDFEHWWRIAPGKGGLTFHHVLRISGLMSGTLNDDYFAMYRAGLTAMNAALKERVEALEANRPRLTVVPGGLANDNADGVVNPGPPKPGAGRRAAG
ncbi:MAG: SRPBCC domain-containing protein [Rhodospirillaceae bacterium]|nr:SRPBCC domain-containing protein [Rhodospirillaceae bacterium]